MTWNITQRCSAGPRRHAGAIFCVCAMLLLAAGCAERRRPVNWRGAGLGRPSVPVNPMQRPNPQAADLSDPIPELRLEMPAPPPLLSARAAPARPHVTPPPASENNSATKPEPPVIAPQLTPAESSAAQQQMNSSLVVAEKNLARTQGRKLNTTQSDLASKVKEFIGDARSAGKEGDWTRARSLATKAQVLSEELASSL